ncbi:hypothetical protein BJ741DRAFT_667811 [Chytriomyces cf. hyalinus JEL632]|nr:hypothetical protein BJ741DRAFT_667811 [Chytriomyces cf. hyalinus JEL632]
MLKIHYALSNDLDLRPFFVTINETDAAVDDFKEVIHTKKRKALAHVDADDLILVRMFKEDMGGMGMGESVLRGLTKMELERMEFQSSAVSQVMNPLTDISKYFTPPPLKGSYHLLRLFELGSDYLAESGLSPMKLVLYCRKDFHDQIEFLCERVMQGSPAWYWKINNQCGMLTLQSVFAFPTTGNGRIVSSTRTYQI